LLGMLAASLGLLEEVRPADRAELLGCFSRADLTTLASAPFVPPSPT